MPDTIVALSSPVGPAPRGVVRLSGPRARELARALLLDAPALAPWRLTPCQLRLPDWPPAPCAALSCPAPRSYTGEDVVELWVPGAPPLVRRLLVTLQERGARLADRGEFTRRAFLAGRLGLLEVEAVLALTQAADAEASRAALRVLEGGVGVELEALKQALLDLRAHLEAAIDFSEEELDLADEEQLARRLDQLAATLSGWRARSQDSGAAPLVALRGPANAGKSALFNHVCGADALVSEQAGTTRDVLEGSWDLGGGLVVRLLDTAGLGAGLAGEAAALDAAALEHAAERVASADLVLWLSPGPERPGPERRGPERRGPERPGPERPGPERLGPERRGPERRGPERAGPERPGPERAGRAASAAPSGALLVRTKRDLCPGEGPPAGELWISAATGAGLDELRAALRERLSRAAPGAGLLGSARQCALLARASAALGRAAQLLRGADPARAELAAVDLAEALESLGQLTGEVTTEDMLGRLFSSFCVGK